MAQHAFTTKPLRLRAVAGAAPEDRAAVAQAWRDAAAAVGGLPHRVARVRQVHGRAVRVLRRGDAAAREVSASAVPEADAMVSNEPGLVLAVQVADCVPVLMADPVSGAVAVVHAGWRGTLAQVVVAAVERMEESFGTCVADLVAAIGPGIGTCCYEVGEDVRTAFRQGGFTGEAVSNWFERHDDGSWRLDLWAANRDQLTMAGVPAGHVHVCGLCTRSHPEIFESFRLEGARAGRMAGLIRAPDSPGAVRPPTREQR